MGPPTREELTMSVSLHVVDEGAGPAVVLLHGFPDSSALWRHQIPMLVEAGYRVIAPDLRGFGASDRPADVDAYRLEASVADILAILDQRGIEQADVVGHDWGAALGWALAGFVPDRVRSLVAVSVGHPAGYFTDTLRQRGIERADVVGHDWGAALGGALAGFVPDRIRSLVAVSVGHPAGYFTDTLRQREMSWYILFFLPPGVAEEALPRDGWTLLRTWLAGQGDDLDRYVADLSRPGALTAALNWYRANLTRSRSEWRCRCRCRPSPAPCWASPPTATSRAGRRR